MERLASGGAAIDIHLIKRYSVFTHGLLEKQVFSFIILVFILVLD